MVPILQNLIKRYKYCNQEERILTTIEIFEILHKRNVFVQNNAKFSNDTRKNSARLLLTKSERFEEILNRAKHAIRELAAIMGWEEIAHQN